MIVEQAPYSSLLNVCKYFYDLSNHNLLNLRLQSLLYFSQGWALGYDIGPLFTENIEAWVSGPVVPIVWQLCQPGPYCRVSLGDPALLLREQVTLLSSIWSKYGNKASLAQLAKWNTDSPPWIEARMYSTLAKPATIDLRSMQKHFSERTV